MKVSRAATQRYYKGSALTFYHLESTCFFLFQVSVIATVVIGLQGNWLISLIAVLLYLIRFIIKAIVFGKSALNASTKPYYRLVIPAGVYSTHIQWICPYLPAFQK